MTPATQFATAPRGVASLPGRMAAATLLFVSVGMFVSALVDAGAGGDDVVSIAGAAMVCGVVGGLLWRLTHAPSRISTTSVFRAVTTTWLVAACAGALPYLLSGTFPVPDDALFESVSGFTGTGSTVLTPIEGSGRGILFWRGLTQWYGGMGMVVLAVAVLPFLGVDGLDLVSAEAPGPTSDRLAPRVRETAKRLWLVYLLFSVLSVTVLLAVGLSLYDAVVHMFTTVSTGGLSPYDASIGHFDSALVEMAFVVLMLIGGINFTLHWAVLSGRPGTYLRSSQLRYYLGLFALTVAALWVLLWSDGFTAGGALRDALFNSATLITSTGYGTVDFVQWIPAAQLVLLLLMFTGGMAGSTAGGLKIIRFQASLVHIRRELRRVAHPRAVLPMKLGGRAVDDPVADRIVGFVLLYVIFIISGTVVLAMLGTDLVTSGTSIVSMMGNMGPGLGESGPASNFLVFGRPARAVLMFFMLAGRLEMFPILLGMFSLVTRVRHPLRRTRARVMAR